MSEQIRHIGIFGGSFNPVHCGHMMVASYLASWTELDEVWLTLSPQNPLKSTDDSATESDRLTMLAMATEGSERLKICDVELEMPRPSYTIDTLRQLRKSHSDCRFRLIIGSDNWRIFSRWKSAEEIISEFGVIIYPRPGYPVETDKLPDRVTFVDAPECSLSSTFLRKSIATGHSIEQMVPQNVVKYIKEHNLYKQ
ncbi:MAG: nicotinate-nucleotide adenylyltransferase [Muribaculaceae bacterium]|nr:nicotinate-nucleotide adenylyltransferase [Muribaculaceae bacterium]